MASHISLQIKSSDVMILFQVLLTLDKAFTLRDPQKDRILGNTSGGASVCIQAKTGSTSSTVMSQSSVPGKLFWLVSITSRVSNEPAPEDKRAVAPVSRLPAEEDGRNMVATLRITPPPAVPCLLFLPAALVDRRLFLFEVFEKILRSTCEDPAGALLMSSKERR